MYWQKPDYLWAELIPGLLLVSWIVSEVLHWRRLRVFGDPIVLGITVPWVSRIAALLMLLLGAACAAAVIPLPAVTEDSAAEGSPVIELLVDVHALESANERTWEAFEAVLQALVEQVPGARFSAIALSSPPEILVYPTIDTQGLQIMLARLRFEMPRSNNPDLARSLSDYAKSRLGAPAVARSVVITALPPGDLERIGASVNDNNPGFVFANVSGGSVPIQYARRGDAGNMVWTAQAADLRQFLDASQIDTGRRAALNPIQWLALMAVIFLGVEYVMGLSGRARTSRIQNV